MRSKFIIPAAFLLLVGIALGPNLYQSIFLSKVRYGYEMKVLLGVRAERLSIAYYLDHKIDPDLAEGPDIWGTKTRASVENGVIILKSAGPDRVFDTQDDITVEEKTR